MYIPSAPVFLIIPSPQLDHVSSPIFFTVVRPGQIGNMCRTKLIRNGYGLRASKLHCSIVPAVGLYNTTLSGSANAVAVHPTF